MMDLRSFFSLSQTTLMPLRSPRRARSRAWLALALCACGCAPVLTGARGERAAEPAIEVTIDERFYEVDGTTPWDLNRALRRNGPRDDADERSWHGATDFALRYRYEPAASTDGCHAADARVQVELVTTLPEWPDRDSAPAWLREDWDLFLSRLREHERGHQRIAIELGQELLRGVEELRASDCEALRIQARRLAMTFQTEGHLEHESFDRQTGHGLAAGEED
jgi:predicted secreted Zn-dependent protease